MIDSTSITLLATEGMLRITFRPALTTPQYEELSELVARSGNLKRQQFREKLARQAQTWGVAFDAKDLDR